MSYSMSVPLFSENYVGSFVGVNPANVVLGAPPLTIVTLDIGARVAGERLRLAARINSAGYGTLKRFRVSKSAGTGTIVFDPYVSVWEWPVPSDETIFQSEAVIVASGTITLLFQILAGPAGYTIYATGGVLGVSVRV